MKFGEGFILIVYAHSVVVILQQKIISMPDFALCNPEETHAN